MTCFECHGSGEIFMRNGDEYDWEYCYCEAGMEKYEQNELYLLDSINDPWAIGELFTTPEAR